MDILLLSDLHYGYNCKENTCLIIEKFLKNIIETEDFDTVVVAGDIISHYQDQWKDVLKLLRKYIPNDPILIVKGNHDWWDIDNTASLIPIERNHKNIFKMFNIQYLEDKPFIDLDVGIYGFDGWYHYLNPPTNDLYCMNKYFNGVPTHQYLSNKAHKQLEKCIKLKKKHNKKVNIIVTHFSSFSFQGDYSMAANPKYLDIIADNGFNYLFEGHTHVFRDEKYKNLRIINVGSDYNNPKHKIIEV